MTEPYRLALGSSWVSGAPVALVSAFLLFGCGGEGSDEASSSPSEDAERTAVAEAIQAEEEAAENLVFKPMDLPSADFSQAQTEREPNDDEETATPLGPDLMVQGDFQDGGYDYYTFTTEGEPQIWAVEASGENLSWVEYRDLSGDRRVRRDPVEGKAVLSNLYLPPGRHILAARGSAGAYTLRAVPFGPPDPTMEMEPNDDESRAHLLRFGRSRLGYLSENRDEDYYRFSLRNPEHLRLETVPPADLAMRFVISGGGGQIAEIRGAGPGDSIAYEAYLPLGEYHVRLTPVDGTLGRLPYRIRLDRLDPFSLPVDMEPNDETGEASPLPPTHVIRGEVGRWGDSRDWYRLPARAEPFHLTVEAVQLPDGLSLNRLVSVRNANGYVLQSIEWSETDSVLAGEVPADTTAFIQVYGEGEYALRVRMDPGPEPVPEDPSSAVEVTLPPGPHVFAAFWPDAQTLDLPVELTNSSEAERKVELAVAVSDARWRVDVTTDAITLEPGASRSVPARILVPPDAWGDHPVRLTVRSAEAGGGIRTASSSLVATCNAPPMAPSLPEPLPPPLLGGINVAWSSLGARIASEDADVISRDEELLDGYLPASQVWYARRDLLPRDVDVDLAGEEPAQVVGVVLNPKGTEDGASQVKDFELWLSEDGRAYERVLSAFLTRQVADQVFALPRPVPARFARLRILSAQGGDETAYMGDWKVIASPGTTEVEGTGINIADPAVGGHVVWSEPLSYRPENPPMLLADEDARAEYLDPANPNEWVVGFHHHRAAQIRRLEWVQPPRDSYPFIPEVRVAASTGSPLGPWTPLGVLELDATPGGTTVMDLPEPVWARYVKLSVTGPEERERWYLPEQIRVFEQPTGAGYLSILGEWGPYARSGAFERQMAGRTLGEPRSENDENETREQAQRLVLATPYAGSVQIGEDTDWYRVEAGPSDNRIRFELRGLPALRIRPRLEDSRGAVVPLQIAAEPDPGVHVVYEAEIVGGEPYFLKIEEPPRSIAMVWDNSGSISPFIETLYPSILSFTKDVRPTIEYVNLLPFRDSPGFLLEEWSDDAYQLLSALNNYDRKDGSSNAYANLLFTVNEMRDREGTKAIVLITDADTGGFEKSGDLWEALSEVRPSIFSVELHRGDVRPQQDLMQSWAGVNAGWYDFFRTGADLGVAFQRATCMIRRPARYELTATALFEEPPLPGFVFVDPGELELNAVELILDASGSMLQRLEGRRRIEIARDVLSDLVSQTIPEGTPLALRVFGHKTPDACDTDLEIPVQPLDRARVTGIIRQTEAMNLAKTPIGESLELVAQDLEDVNGQKLIMLITDGEETCEGDPAAAIRGLKEAGHDVRVNIVGFAIDDEGLKSQFESWAREGGGLYFDASSSQELAEGVDRALRPKFQVLAETGEVVGEGTAGLDPVEVPVGRYTVRILTSPLRTVTGVQVISQDTARVGMPAPPGGGRD